MIPQIAQKKGETKKFTERPSFLMATIAIATFTALAIANNDPTI